MGKMRFFFRFYIILLMTCVSFDDNRPNICAIDNNQKDYFQKCTIRTYGSMDGAFPELCNIINVINVKLTVCYLFTAEKIQLSEIC